MPNSSVIVRDVALPLEQIVVLRPVDMFRSAVEAMSKKRLGISCIVDGDGLLVGVFTDGDIRRMLLRDHRPIAALFSEDIADHMTRNPQTVNPDMTLGDAVSFMETMDVLDLPMVDQQGHLKGLLHLHTALKHLLGL